MKRTKLSGNNSKERLGMLGLPQTEFWSESMALGVIHGDVSWLKFPQRVKEMKKESLRLRNKMQMN